METMMIAKTNVKQTKATPAQERKMRAELEDYYLNLNDSIGFVYIYVHNNDQRHVIVDTRLNKIVKRFRDGEMSWADANRFADDYYYEHRFDGEA